MNISEFAARSGLGAHALRYYKKLGLLPAIARNASGHRDFPATPNCASPARPRSSNAACCWQAHAAALEAEFATQNAHLQRIRAKIAYDRTL